MTASTKPPVVVVGVDGSLGSVVALRWAAEQARRTGAELHVVHVWPPTSSAVLGVLERSPEEAYGELEMTLAYALGEEPYDVPVVPTVLHGRPGHVLVERAADADLLVVGSHGRGTVGSLLLGSVGQYCARHSRCPVVIVPTPPEFESEHVVSLHAPAPSPG